MVVVHVTAFSPLVNQALIDLMSISKSASFVKTKLLEKFKSKFLQVMAQSKHFYRVHLQVLTSDQKVDFFMPRLHSFFTKSFTRDFLISKVANLFFNIERAFVKIKLKSLKNSIKKLKLYL